MIAIGFVMVVVGGIVLPLLMVIKALTSTYFLNFFSYGVSVSGLFLGIIGSAMYVRLKKPHNDLFVVNDEGNGDEHGDNSNAHTVGQEDNKPPSGQ